MGPILIAILPLLAVISANEICDPNPCQHGSTCVVHPEHHNYTCVCAPGFHGLLCDQANHPDPDPTPIDPHHNGCDSNPCQNGGSCMAHGDSYSCMCPPHWHGHHCDHQDHGHGDLHRGGHGFLDLTRKDHLCDSAPCQNNGTCVPNSHDTNYHCDCAPGWHGHHCDHEDHVTDPTPIDPDNNGCDSNPCQNGGSCMAHGDSYSCMCPPHWHGHHCDHQDHGHGDVHRGGHGFLDLTRKDHLCDSAPCQNNGTCVPNSHDTNYHCDCAPGWHGHHCDHQDH